MTKGGDLKMAKCKKLDKLWIRYRCWRDQWLVRSKWLHIYISYMVIFMWTDMWLKVQVMRVVKQYAKMLLN